MRYTKGWIIVGVVSLLLAHSSVALSQSSSTQAYSTQILRNADVLAMVKRGMTTDAMTERILRSTCNFDVFPPVLEDLRRRGIPETIIQLMTVVPNGPPAQANLDNEEKPETAVVTLPRGFGIQVETLYPVSSAKFKVGNSIALVVVEPAYVDGVLVVSRGTVARAQIVKLEKAKLLGRGGALTWKMHEIRAVDGTMIPVQLSSVAEGNDHGVQMAAGVAATAAVVFPYTAPAAVVWAFKKGDDAVVRGNQRFGAIVKDDTEVVGLVPDNDRVIYHYGAALKAKAKPTSTTTAFPRLGVRN